MEQQLQHKIDFKTKPLGSLGMLEKLALQIGKVQNTLSPTLTNPHMIVFAGDHGIAHEGVSPFPQEVTFQMVMNFLQGGAAINSFCMQHDINLKVVDSGVNYDFEPNTELINLKVGRETASFLTSKAMTPEQYEECIEKGRSVVKNAAQEGCNVIGFGEMGIGNTSPATMILSQICHLSIEECTGRGSGINDEGLQKKLKTLQAAKAFHGDIEDANELMRTYGGFEMAQMLGGFLEAKDQGMVILVDGFITTSVFMVAAELNPSILENAIFSHQSDEGGHRKMLEHLGGEPVLKLNLRLGEGTGAAVAYPVVKSAVQFLSTMASFEDAGVSNHDEFLDK
ncbi:nicotinate-nucleotide--dimethylbenzimidazole phosphoribosyltransferase [Flammeovirga sp. SJP92]|uniref:nicotinate-nucleotide--dimethylbenzimidazole phosphoribosyltransferase n=1 Tax=Flammeovirga sp. SJP92 TaxID=1775430 RepID=UPI000788AB53|nr:nicotinate-nucleotide--dimethylbenzimidazole phosphoribosyltransferase [Flammeovirga sp. SJP92]KXX66754.1 nicotinate-nucleotide--dimethylbenzimidazole phosphoribosyltransferase [Flammeovirga sp. SJP92]